MLSERSLQPAPANLGVGSLFRNQKLVIGVLVVVFAIGYLVATSLQNTAVYYMTIPELQANTAVQSTVVRVNGKVKIGSAEYLPNGSGVKFVMHDEADQSKTMLVTYKGIVPDTFRDESDVVVEGKISPSGEFQAHTLLAKCPSKFSEA